MNNDGLVDGGEPGVAGVEVILLNVGTDNTKGTGDDVEVQIDTTDSAGNYLFTFVGQGEYYVKINGGLPTGYISSNGASINGSNPITYEPGATTNDNANNDDDGTQIGTKIMSEVFELTKNTEPTNDEDADNNTNLSIDFGIIPSISLGNLVLGRCG